MATDEEHKHQWVGVPGGRMLVLCTRGHSHDVDDAPGFEVCHCGAATEVPPYPCDETPTPKCYRHSWARNDSWNGSLGEAPYPVWQCVRCNVIRDEVRRRRNR